MLFSFPFAHVAGGLLEFAIVQNFYFKKSVDEKISF
jgi:hypothetical protein